MTHLFNRPDFRFFLLIIGVSFVMFITVGLCSCGNSYSPLDTYISTGITSDSLNRVSQIEGQQFIDSLDSFKDGDILYPDYACPDTLIVMNGIALDSIFRSVDLPSVATDSEIDSVLHRYCFTFDQYVDFNIGQGYRADIALHLALVDFNRIKADDLYYSIMED